MSLAACLLTRLTWGLQVYPPGTPEAALDVAVSLVCQCSSVTWRSRGLWGPSEQLSTRQPLEGRLKLQS